MYEIWRWSNLGLAFLVELAGLAIFAWWGWNASSSTALRLGLTIGLPVFAAVLWGLFAAPTADYGSPVITTIVKVAFFGLAGLALWTLDHHFLAAVFVLVVVANLVIIHAGHLTVTATPS
ncbi:YrdB family protein [Kribbella sp. NPDC051718]|uniref:YrdB family protein n=1 Tax=Kribbella sp. NPDC051718 TaxID=3155168 RepID=UPI00341460B7